MFANKEAHPQRNSAQIFMHGPPCLSWAGLGGGLCFNDAEDVADDDDVDDDDDDSDE